MPGILKEQSAERSVPGAKGPEQGTALPLVERRRAGETFPRVPVGSVELTREQVAAGLYTQHGTLPELPKQPTDLELLAVLESALTAYGPVGLDDARHELESLPLGTQAAATSWAFAYRLCVEHWYADALAEPIGVAEMTLALYTSDIPVTRSRTVCGDRIPEIDGHLMEGVARLGARTLTLLQDNVLRELGYPGFEMPPALRERSQRLMPDSRRRRFCHAIAVNRQMETRPLMVMFDAGGFAVGATPPECPYGARMVAHIRSKGGRA
ncbi:hypothetical protein [Streptomyces huiliensis]|uniref:hypothetical protein n=1 Tax=Streptomyces huiliensis TaxID=2876027 RepID=UPI001CBF3CC7|nr:hypothetical protein [Streptomyces huiliensis]MBZ4323761.1 hypothetical protein [Streptomyces huiliensis]